MEASDTTLRSSGLLAFLLSCTALLSGQTLLQFDRHVKQALPVALGWKHALGDFDGDKDVDIVLFPSTANTLPSMLVNDGGGVFRHVTLGILWDSFRDLAAGDVDGDGDLDIVACTGATGRTKGRTRLFLNDGKGKFTDATSQMPADAQYSESIALADLDGDKDLDVVVGNAFWNQVSRQNRLYLNDGRGRFSDATSGNLPVDSDGTHAIAIGDIDNDKDLDIVFGNGFLAQQKNKVLLNDGNAKFSEYTLGGLDAARSTNTLVLCDVEGDGDLDLVEGTYGPFGESNHLHLNQLEFLRRLAFVESQGMPPDPDQNESIAVGDADGDGDCDLFFGNLGFDRLLLNNGRGLFVPSPDAGIAADQGWTSSAEFFDGDGDGKLDLFAARSFVASKLYWNAGGGRFFDPGEPLGPDLGLSWAGGDFDRDGLPDLLGASRLQNELFLGRGTGRFVRVTGTQMPPDSDRSTSVAVADFDGDGDLDAVFGNDVQRVTLYLNDGRGRFTDATSRMPRGVAPARVVVAGDIDGDGDRDVIVGNETFPDLVYVNDGKARFADETVRRLTPRFFATRDAVLVDVDGDRDLDLVTANSEFGLFGTKPEQNRLFLNDGKGVFRDATGAFPQRADLTISVSAADVDGDGNQDLMFCNTSVFGPSQFPSSIYLGDGKGGFRDATAQLIGLDRSPAARMRAFDAEGDGDLDLLLSGAALFGKTKLFIRHQGRFLDRTSTRISDAVGGDFLVVDVDVDGDQDLLFGSRLLLNRHRQVWSPSLARLGGTWNVVIFVEPGYAPGPRAVLPLLGLRTLDPGLRLPPFGRLRIDPNMMLVQPPRFVTARDRISVPIPSASSLTGLPLATQALILHGTVLNEARFSNLHRDVMFR